MKKQEESLYIEERDNGDILGNGLLVEKKVVINLKLIRDFII